MRYAEIDILGVYVAPFVLMILVAWLITLPLRRVSEWFGVARHVWHPALFNAAIYVIVLSVVVLAAGCR